MRHRGAIGRVLAVVLAVCGLLMASVQPASAAVTAKLIVGVAANAPTTLSGEDLTWTISWSCSSITEGEPCRNAKVTVPLPLSQPDGLIPVYKSMSHSPSGTATVASETYNATTRTLTWTMQPTIPGGSSGQLLMVLRSRNYITPAGSVFDPTVTFTAANADSETATGAPITVNSTAAVVIGKSRFPGNSTAEPRPGETVTYSITARNKYTLASSTPPGVQSLVNATVTDHLPSTAIFVSAQQVNVETSQVADCTHDGVTPGGVVTCPPWTDEGEGFNRRGVTVYVTVRYPTTQPAAGSITDPSDDVTNTASVQAHGPLRPDYIVSATANVSHGFLPASGGSPGFNLVKTNRNENPVYQGGSAMWLNQIYNTGTVPLSFAYTDHFPCQYTSPASIPCSPQGYLGTSFAVSYGYADPTHPLVATATLDNGDVVTHSWSGPETANNRNWVPGRQIVSVTWSGYILPGDTMSITYVGTVPATLPIPSPAKDSLGYKTLSAAALANDSTYLENCLSDISFTVAGSSPVPVTGNRCAIKQVLPVTPQCGPNCTKLASNATQAPGGEITFTLSVQNSGTREMRPQILDLLPAELDYVPGSLVLPAGWAADATIEVLPNYRLTGRTLLRMTWPDTTVLPVNALLRPVVFRAVVRPGVAVGTYTNRVVYGDKTDPAGLCPSRATVDVYDLDGDGSFADIQCGAPANFVVAELGAMAAWKEVRGSADTAYQSAPSVGVVAPGATGSWRLHLTNTGSVSLDQVVAYEILPYVEDTAIGPGISARGSQWQNILASVTVPDDVSVEYSESTNPCRGEVLSSGGAQADGPANCVSDWTSTAPDDLGTVRALRFVIGDSDFAPGEERVIGLEVRAPEDAVGISWNTVSMAGHRSVGWLAPTEAPKTGLTVTSTLQVSKADADTGLSVPGATFQLSSTGPDGVIGGTDDAVIGTCTTDTTGICLVDGLVPGSYFWAETVAPVGYELPESAVSAVITVSAENAGTTFPVTVVGDPQVRSVLSVVKHDADSGVVVDGATFVLSSTGPDGVVGGGDDVVVGSCTTADLVACSVDGLLFGSYFWAETVAPVGYELPESAVSAVITVSAENAGTTFPVTVIADRKLPAPPTPSTPPAPTAPSVDPVAPPAPLPTTGASELLTRAFFGGILLSVLGVGFVALSRRRART